MDKGKKYCVRSANFLSSSGLIVYDIIIRGNVKNPAESSENNTKEYATS